MNIKLAEQKAIELINKYGLSDYNFEFDNAVSRFGYCNNTDKKISLSKNLVELNSEEAVTSTIIHEIAHALTPNQGHNEVWQRVDRALGDDGKRCYDDTTETPLAKYTAICPNCQLEITRNVKRKRLACSKCIQSTPSKRWSKKFMFKWRRN
jgi:hypothetical protein